MNTPIGLALPHMYAIVGPTASGKSELAVKIAKKVGGEIISCDSRQVYKGLDIGTGKITGHRENSDYVYKGIVHYGIDIASPRTQYSVSRFQNYCTQVLKKIVKRKKRPILCGGTGHWIDAVAFNQQLPNIRPNQKLREQLSRQPLPHLVRKLQKLDPIRAANIDTHNPRRVIRALEISLSTGKPVPQLLRTPTYNTTWIGIHVPRELLFKKIEDRLSLRLEQGLVAEVAGLAKKGISWKRLEAFGLEYRYISLYLQKKVDYKTCVSELDTAIKAYAKRQLTWFKRNPSIHWVTSEAEALHIVEGLLKGT